jgi:D-beta-D-heptose 7-phosphate kinase/D-beta-D-heptose 1-phosphate adenosyltransferase
MRIGFTNGCMDLFHDGHHHYLARCKEQCDYLIVALNSDDSVKRLKGPARPRQEWATRYNNVMDTGLVDAVIPFEGRWENLVMEIRPHVIFQGAEYRKEGTDHLVAVRRPGWKTEGHASMDRIPVIYIERIPGHSTSLQIERLAAKTNA